MSATWWTSGALIAAVLAFVVREVLIGGTGWLAGHIITRAARRLPEDRSELRREEWLAEYDAIVAKGLHLTGLIHACGTYFGAIRMAPSRQRAATIKRMLSTVRQPEANFGAKVAINTITVLITGITLLAAVKWNTSVSWMVASVMFAASLLTTVVASMSAMAHPARRKRGPKRNSQI